MAAIAAKVDNFRDVLPQPEENLRQLVSSVHPLGPAGSPARDQQLRLERDVLHSLSARTHRPHGIRRGSKLALIVGIAVATWASIVAVPLIISVYLH